MLDLAQFLKVLSADGKGMLTKASLDEMWRPQFAKKDEKTRLAIQNTALDTLQWLIDDGVVSKIDVQVEWLADPLEGVGITVTSSEPGGVQRDWHVDQVWAGIAG